MRAAVRVVRVVMRGRMCDCEQGEEGRVCLQFFVFGRGEEVDDIVRNPLAEAREHRAACRYTIPHAGQAHGTVGASHTTHAAPPWRWRAASNAQHGACRAPRGGIVRVACCHGRSPPASTMLLAIAARTSELHFSSASSRIEHTCGTR